MKKLTVTMIAVLALSAGAVAGTVRPTGGGRLKAIAA